MNNRPLSKPNGLKSLVKICFLLFVWVSWAGDNLRPVSNPSIKQKLMAKRSFVSREIKISSFLQLYTHGSIHAEIDSSLSGDKIKIVGDADTVKKVCVHMQPRKRALFLRLPSFETTATRYLTVFIPAPMLQEVYHGSTGTIHIKNVKKPLKLFATGNGLLSIEGIQNSTVYLKGTANSQVRLSGVIDTLEVYLQDEARLDATQAYVQRSFIKTYGDAQVFAAAGARLTGVRAADYSIVRYTYDPPATGLFVSNLGRILRETSQ